MTLVYFNVKLEDILFLKKIDYGEVSIKNEYEVTRLANEDTLLILYSSGKLVVQTSPKYENLIKKQLSHLSLESFPHKNEFALKQNVIGSDESLKGDTFGGIVVCAFYCDENDFLQLQNLNVKDSKKLNDEQITFIATQLEEHFKDKFFVKELEPQEYNELLSIETSTKLLNDLHSFVGDILKRKFPLNKQIVDKFPGCIAGDFSDERAEEKYLAVAAASIIARYRALKQIQNLSKKAKFILPLGSTHVQEALEKLKEKKLNPKNFCKLHFKNVQKVFSL